MEFEDTVLIGVVFNEYLTNSLWTPCNVPSDEWSMARHFIPQISRNEYELALCISSYAER